MNLPTDVAVPVAVAGVSALALWLTRGVWTGARRWLFESDGERMKREGANFISFADAAKPSRWERLIRRG